MSENGSHGKSITAYYYFVKTTEKTTKFREVGSVDDYGARVIRPLYVLAGAVEELGSPRYVKVTIQGVDKDEAVADL